MNLEEKINTYLNEKQMFEVGDFIKQEGNDFTTYAQVVANQKAGHKVAAFTVYHDTKSTAGKAVFKSTKGWYPVPKTISENEIPDKILKKIKAKSGL